LLESIEQQLFVKAFRVDALVPCKLCSNAVGCVDNSIDEFTQRVVGFGARLSVECPSEENSLVPQLSGAC